MTKYLFILLGALALAVLPAHALDNKKSTIGAAQGQKALPTECPSGYKMWHGKYCFAAPAGLLLRGYNPATKHYREFTKTSIGSWVGWSLGNGDRVSAEELAAP